MHRTYLLDQDHVEYGTEYTHMTDRAELMLFTTLPLRLFENVQFQSTNK